MKAVRTLRSHTVPKSKANSESYGAITVIDFFESYTDAAFNSSCCCTFSKNTVAPCPSPKRKSGGSGGLIFAIAWTANRAEGQLP
jgi:hypothetical protein